MNEELIKLANKIDRLARTARVQDLSLLLSQSEFGDPQDPSTARSRDPRAVEEAAELRPKKVLNLALDSRVSHALYVVHP